MHKSLEKFKPYVEKRLLRQVISPCGKLVLWNYTDACTYERAWDEITLNARGTVYELSTGEVVARAFPKFFNFGEHQDDKKKQILNSKNFECFEKMDGSLGIVYYYGGEWRVNTRGSFTSDQAIKGKAMLDSKYDMINIGKKETLLVEIIYPENKIIVNYGLEEKLVLIGMYDLGSSIPEDPSQDWSHVVSDYSKMSVAPSIKFDTIEALQEHLLTLDHQEEGYVVRLENGERVKFKSTEYMRIARMISCMTPLAFWKAMENGKVKVDYLEHLPEEFRVEADQLVEELEAAFSKLWWTHHAAFESNRIRHLDGRKEIALVSKEKDLNISAMFAILDHKDKVIDKIIMKQIRPKANQIGG